MSTSLNNKAAIDDNVLLYIIKEHISFKDLADKAYLPGTNILAFGQSGSDRRRGFQFKLRDIKNRLKRGTLTFADIPPGLNLRHIFHIGSSSPKPAETSSSEPFQLYVLSARKHRDAIRLGLQRARAERDRANLAFVQAERWLSDADERVAHMEEEAKDAQAEYIEARMSASRMAATGLAEESGDKTSAAEERKRPRKGERYQKAPLISDLLVEMAKSGQLVDGKKLYEIEEVNVNPRDRAKFVNAMVLVEQLWTEEEELFLRSPVDEIAESIEELEIIAAAIAERCLVKLNEWEGRKDPTSTPYQKPSIVSVGIKATNEFLERERRRMAVRCKGGGEGGKVDEEVIREKKYYGEVSEEEKDEKVDEEVIGYRHAFLERAKKDDGEVDGEEKEEKVDEEEIRHAV